MFKKRSDGRLIKSIYPLCKIMPYIMKTRNDSQVYYEDKICIEKVEEYIKKKREEGVKISHMDVVVAAMSRVALERPGLNRFIMNNRIYARKNLTVSLALKKKLDDAGIETTVKFKIKPTDTILDIANQIHETVYANKTEKENNTDKLVDKIMSLPNFLIAGAVNFLMWMDKHNMLPKGIIELSPFHTSFFVTNMGSLGIDSIYHHIYNFGTTSVFLAMGMKKEQLDVDSKEPQKYISFKFVCDERICDGLYYARSFSAFRRYMLNPELLEVASINVKEDIK
ncbi:MAG: 2-oxoglutarate dehydrogenase [Clostridia bacterium]|nr:2-oxoglutarate dehydrogenase [Clostridia bacterium]